MALKDLSMQPEVSANKQTIKLFGCEVLNVTSSCTLDLVAERVERRDFTQHGCINAGKVVNMCADHKLKKSVQNCDFISIDGMGVVWAARLMGHTVSERVTGIDLFLQLLPLVEAREYPVYLLGATQNVLDRVTRKMKKEHPDIKIVGVRNGYFEQADEESIVSDIAASGARVLFVAMSSPKKENFVDDWKLDLGVDFVMGVGGSFDVYAGITKRAPKFIQQVGLEWLYRVLQEPRRLWRRYLTTNVKFIVLVVKEIFAKGELSNQPAKTR